MGIEDQRIKEEFKEFLSKMDRRLSRLVFEPLSVISKNDGFDSPCEWLYFVTKIQRETITSISKKTGIKKRTIAAIIQRSLETEEDEVLIETSREWREKTTDLCLKCGKRQKTGYYYCRECANSARRISKYMDLETFGDY